MRTFVGITGASGHAYARRLVQALVDLGGDVDLALTGAGVKVLRQELGVDAGTDGGVSREVLSRWFGAERVPHLRAFRTDAVEAPPSSGTSRTTGVVLCPCSMGTVARVAAGFSSNLVERAADVALKEGRTLIVVPREAPMSPLHLENLLRLARLGAVILPAAPGFYHRPQSIDDLVDHVVGKILDRLGLEHSVGARWGGPSDPPDEAGTGAPAPRDPLGEPRDGRSADA